MDESSAVALLTGQMLCEAVFPRAELSQKLNNSTVHILIRAVNEIVIPEPVKPKTLVVLAYALTDAEDSIVRRHILEVVLGLYHSGRCNSEIVAYILSLGTFDVDPNVKIRSVESLSQVDLDLAQEMSRLLQYDSNSSVSSYALSIINIG